MSTIHHPLDFPTSAQRGRHRRSQRNTGVDTGTPTQVLVMDERAAIRAGVRAVLSGERDLHIEATGTWSAAIKHATGGRAGLCLVDYGLARGGTGLFLTYRLKEVPRPPRVVLYSEFVDGYLAGAAKLAGADALICQNAPGDELAQVLRLVASGERHFPMIPPSAMYELCKHLDPADRPILTMAAHDTPREYVSEVMGITGEWLGTRTWAILQQLHNSSNPHRPLPWRSARDPITLRPGSSFR
jgi:DNA-binding NarL/FixJ family response regulator